MFVTVSNHVTFLESLRNFLNHASRSRSGRTKLDTLLAVDLITLPLFVYLLGVASYGLAIQKKLCSTNVAYMLVLVAFGTVGEVAMLPFEYRLLLDSSDHLAWQQWLIILGVFATLFV